MNQRLTSLLLVALWLGACGLRSKTPGDRNRPIDRLRAEAAKAPNDRSLWSTLLAYETFGAGGEAARARKALAAVKRLGAQTSRTRFIEAELAVLEGRPGAALAAYADALRGGLNSEEPLAEGIAEASLSSIGDMNDAVDDYRGRVDRLLDALARTPTALGLNAAHQLRMQRLGRALLKGDTAAARSEATLAGCVQRAEVLGPFGPRELLGFDVVMPGEGRGPLAAEAELGPGRGKAPKRVIETQRCVLGLGRGVHDPRGGATLLRSEVGVKQAGVHALRVESPNRLVVWLDGKEVLRLDGRTQTFFGVRYVPLTLAAGRHEVRVKLASRHPNPALSLALVPATEQAIARSAVPSGDDPLASYLAAKLLLARGDAMAARERLQTLGATDRPAAVLVLEAATALADPLRSAEMRRDHARELLRKAGAHTPAAWYPVVGLAGLEAAEGHLKEAVESLRAAVPRWPDVVAIRTGLIEQLRARGFNEEADRLVAELAARMPHACAVTTLALQAAQRRGRLKELRSLTEKAMACDAASGARLSLLRAERNYEGAAREFARLQAVGDVMDAAQRLDAELELALLAEDGPRIRALQEKRSALWFDRPEPVLARADALLSRGQKKEAIAYLAKAIARKPDPLFDLRRVHEALGGEGLFASYRKDGAEIIRAFEASGRTYREPQVLLLDYTVVNVFEDGSSTDLTHNIMRLQSQESVDENGEFAVPEGARLLKLHTIKSDGTRLEPDVIGGKDTLSLPSLSPGDYVEFEYVRPRAPSGGFPGGYLGDRFYFRSFEVPFDHSELVIVLPPSMEPVLDPRGPLPKTQRTTRDGRTVLRWVAEESRPLSPEPMSVASREFLPSINLGVRASWSAYVESLRDLLADKNPVDPAAQRLVSSVLGDARKAPASQRAARLFRWVTDQIEATQDLFGLAPAMLAARTGSRDRVLSYMLTLAGIEHDLALVRGADADHSVARVPDPETFGYLLLRVQTERGPVWLHTGLRHAPFGYLPAHLRGEQALLLNARAERVETPGLSLDQERRELDIDVALEKTGAAEVHVRETLRGAQAIRFRNDLEEVPEAQFKDRFEESYVARLVPGASLAQLEIGQREDPDKPLILDFTFKVDQLGQRVGPEQRIGGLFPSALSPTLARDSERTVPQLVGMALVTDVRLQVTLPKGAKVGSVPPDARFAYAGLASFKLEGGASKQGVRVTRQLRVPVMRVSPGAYREFSDFCRRVDLSEAGEISVRMP